jgi:ABC-type transport system involved in multi-copper enzyme maturation permease subunit
MGLWHIISIGYDGVYFTQGLLAASLFTLLEMAIITAFAILFSSFSSPTLSAFLTVIVFIIGRLNQDLYLFADTMATRAGGLVNLSGGQVVAYYFSKGSAYLTPNLSIFDKRQQIAQFEPVDFGFLDLAYGVVYTTLVLVIAVMIFNRRNFK